MNKFRNILLKLCGSIFIGLLIAGCSSVFSGGTGGTVVDAESTSNPKAGIANVDVYAYTSSSARDKDYDKWIKGKQDAAFKPTADYYGHTTTGADGSFTISKLMWKSKPFNSKFGKDADYTKIYLIYYHADYGCTKGDTIILSDSASDYTYVELKSIVKRTNLTLNFTDATSGFNTNDPVYVEISVPQKTDSDSYALDKVYTASITGAGIVTIRYPRYMNEDGIPTFSVTNKENNPKIYVNYYQATTENNVSWKACYFNDDEYGYKFRDDVGADWNGIEATVANSPYSLTFYGKKRIIPMPIISGQYKNSGDERDDGVEIVLKRKINGIYEKECGVVTTNSQEVGTSGILSHGNFSNLGNNYLWIDEDYEEQFAKAEFGIFVNGTFKKDITLRSDQTRCFVQL